MERAVEHARRRGKKGDSMSTVQCNHPAVTAAMWPNGQRLVLCATCYPWALKVAGALGMGLMTDELRDGETVCTQKVDPERAASINAARALAGGEQ